ncbi:MAG: U32 family peptidase [Treponema sp.]|jgi:putative protease|nr:U32 family peptidase [Treponema sp.]
MTPSKVELLAPAGSPEALDAAVGEGADGVYLGLKNFNARLRSANFAYAQFEGALRSLRRMGRKLYVTVNTVFEQREADRVYQLLKYLAALGPDGIIVQDFGVVKMVRDNFPSLKLHASTQMNVACARGTNLLSKQGFSRVVLARELSLEEIKRIRGRTNLELEIFIHGALCVSASGLCLFSSFLGGKSANRGMCTQACRRLYHTPETRGYFFSPSDLQLIDHVPALADAGINSFKIEGRMKSAEYVGTVVAAYRRVIDGLGGNREKALEEGRALLQSDFARAKTSFYIDADRTGSAPPDWLKAEQDGGTGIALGKILKVRGSGAGRRALIKTPSPAPSPGDSLRFHRADDSLREAHKLTALEAEGTDAEKCWISLPEGFEIGDSVYLIQTRSMSRHYAPVIPKNLEAFKRTPGREKAPAPSLPPAKQAFFPEGIYAAAGSLEDLYIIQSVRPVKVMLAYTRSTAARLSENAGSLPFAPEDTILVLDPWFPQEAEESLEKELGKLLALGYRYFVVNNLGQLSCFRVPAKHPVRPVLVAGPFLYAFNRWSAAFIAGLGPEALISPLENNRQNLERSFSREGGLAERRRIFITVYAYPALFRIRKNLEGVYAFTNFSDSRDESFRLVNRPEGSLVIPERSFSIIDKIPFMREAGFRRFIVDLSGPPLRKKDYRNIMKAVENKLPLADASRFNWKDGFYHSEGA